VESVIQQLTPQVEFIIVDGLSTDGTNEYLSIHLSQIDHYISERDTGIYSAMNKGWKLASGEYVLYINSDDKLFPGFVKSFFNSNIGSDMIIGNVVYLNLLGREVGTFFPKLIEGKKNYLDMPCSHQGLLMKKNLMLTLGGFDERYSIAADYDLFLKAIFSKATYTISTSTISCFRLGGAGENFWKRSLEIKKIHSVYNLPKIKSFFFLGYSFLSYFCQRIFPKSLVVLIKKLKKSKYLNEI
jgi:glycosyltransferase involved in cell wall biosynthesis